jgi:hypothetical protein
MRIHKLKIGLCFLLLNFGYTLYSQKSNRGDYRLMFYNTENLFDTIDTPNKNDEEFLPDSDKNWDSYRYWKKLKMIYQVIAAAGESSPPEIIGMCEVESFLPLYNLANNTPLSKYPYTIVHQDSPDTRGIDVALLIRNDKVQLIDKVFLKVIFPFDTSANTREILHACLRIQEDTLHVFVNHWPSRRGGEIKSEPRRMVASKVLQQAINSIKTQNPDAKIVVLGDFNDEPQNKSLQQLTSKTDMVNLSQKLQKSCKCGSYKYRSKWNMIDQVIVSKSLLKMEQLYTTTEKISVFSKDFLLIDDTSYGGTKPNRTYLGPRYMGGYSDHLPVLIDLEYQDAE